MPSKFRQYFDLIKDAGSEFGNDNATKLSASLAYYTIFSIGPLLLVVITIMGWFYERGEVTNRVFEQLSTLVGASGSAQLKSILDNISTEKKDTTFFSIIGAIVLTFGATGIFTEIQSSINYIWSIKSKPKKGWVKYLTDRLLSFSLIIGTGFLMLVSLFINLLLDLLTGRLQVFLGDGYMLLIKGFNLGLLFCVVTFLFAVIYKVLPDAKISWRDAMTGAACTGALFLLGKFIIGYYIGSSKTSNTYGAAASIIILLTWVYYSSMILYFGAEFTKVYAMKMGQGITIYDTAVYIVKKEAKEVPGAKHPDVMTKERHQPEG